MIQPERKRYFYERIVKFHHTLFGKGRIGARNPLCLQADRAGLCCPWGVYGMPVDVNIISEIEPAPGLQMKSTLVTAWKLTRNSDQTVVLDKLVEKSHKATPGSFVGVRTAVEGAVRDSITAGIQELSRPGLVK